jgi:hypothetical protein
MLILLLLVVAASATLAVEEPDLAVSNGADDRQLQSSSRLRMYWQKGYMWQESPYEWWWCMQCDGYCRVNRPMKIRECSNNNNWLQIYDTNGNGEAMIRDPDTDLCLTARRLSSRRFSVVMQWCNVNDSQQRWWTAGNGSFGGGGPFEIQPAGFTNEFCLKTQHHPKDGEKTKLTTCAVARKTDTSYWIKY